LAGHSGAPSLHGGEQKRAAQGAKRLLGGSLDLSGLDQNSAWSVPCRSPQRRSPTPRMAPATPPTILPAATPVRRPPVVTSARSWRPKECPEAPATTTAAAAHVWPATALSMPTRVTAAPVHGWRRTARLASARATAAARHYPNAAENFASRASGAALAATSVTDALAITIETPKSIGLWQFEPVRPL
jgi:hypothetical protein